MFEPLKAILKPDRHQGRWEEEDLRMAVQDFLRERLLSQAVYCDEVKLGTIKVRVGTSANLQEARLAEYDLREFLKNLAAFEMGRLIVWIDG